MKVEASHEGSTYNKPYLGWAIAGRTKGGKAYIGVPTQLIGKTAEDAAVLEAVQNALKIPAA